MVVGPPDSPLGRFLSIRKKRWILSLYPQVIEHTEYKGMPLAVTQIVWLKLDCPHDGSRGELCYRFCKAVDDAVGSEFFDQYKRSRITID